MENNNNLPPEVDQKLDQIIAKYERVSPVLPSEEEQKRFLNSFSLGALTFGFIYFWQMNDRVCAISSLICATIFPPALLYFPFVARRRAFHSRSWTNFNQFKLAQKKWDQFGMYFLLISILLACFLVRILFGYLDNFLSSSNTDPNQLRQLQQELQDINSY